MSEMLARVPWYHAKRSSAGLPESLHNTRARKLAHWATFLKPTLGRAPLRPPCLSRLVRDAGATLSRARFVRGAAPSRTAARGPSGCRSRSVVRSATLASSHRRRHSPRCEHHDLSPCLELLSRLPFHENQSPSENVHRNNFSKWIDHPLVTHSPSV